MENQTKIIIKFFIAPLILLNILSGVAYFRLKPDFLLHVHFYDVGQGDGMMIQTYLNHKIVIDGGPSDAILKDLGEDLPFFDRTIDMLMLTHPHADHVTGLVDILKRYEVKLVMLPDVEFNSAPYAEFLRLVKEKHIKKIFAHAGQRVWLDPSTVFDVYYPGSGQFEETASNEGFGAAAMNVNDASIVGKLSFGKSKILFTGDAGMNVERLLAQFDLKSQILKVGHHGSRFSTSADFVSKVSPQYGVIEVGANNTYGHPTQQTLDTLTAANVQIFRTDEDHNVEFSSDGVNLYPAPVSSK